MRLGRSRKAISENETEMQLDISQDISGILYQVAKVICQAHINDSKELCILYLNSAVSSILKLKKRKEEEGKLSQNLDENIQVNSIESWDDEDVKEKYFLLLRCGLVHKKHEVRTASLRLLRHTIVTEEDVLAVIKTNMILLIIRCIDICLDNHSEREHGIRLARHILQISAAVFPLALARCLVAIAKDGESERDKLLRATQAILNELAILNPKIFIESGGISCTLYGILDCPFPRVNEALLLSILFLLNDPKWRHHCSHLYMIMAPFSDINYCHKYYDHKLTKSEERGEREVRVQSSILATLAALRSWSGLITLYQSETKAIKGLIALLKLPEEDTRQVILEFLYDLFRIPYSDAQCNFKSGLKDYLSSISFDLETFRLHEGFVVTEGKAVLPHIAKYRPNLIQNYFSLVLYVFFQNNLVESLCDVIVTASDNLSIKATILLGELLHQASLYHPLDFNSTCHALPKLTEMASGKLGSERLRAYQAIDALLAISKSKFEAKENKLNRMSFYLRNVLSLNGEQTDTDGTIDQNSRWLGTDHDYLIEQIVKDSLVLNSERDFFIWDWSLILNILRWPSSSFLILEDLNNRTFLKRLLHHFKPSSGMFSTVDLLHPTAKFQTEAFLLFCQFLIKLAVQGDQQKYLSQFLNDLKLTLESVVCEHPTHDSDLRPARLNTTLSQYYFLGIGILTKTQIGYDALFKAGIFELLFNLVEVSSNDMYAKLISASFSYAINGFNRTILEKILTSCRESIRIYGTQLLRIYIRAKTAGFTKWGIPLLVNQLHDKSKLVTWAALDVLDEALDDEEFLEAILKLTPSLPKLGQRGQLLIAKLLSSVNGFRLYHEKNLIRSIVEEWSSSFNMKYVLLMQTALSESLTQHQRGEDGHYGRRTGSKHFVHDVHLVPHLYGSLTLYKDGFEFLRQYAGIENILQVLRKANTSSQAKILELKASIWTLANMGRSSRGVYFLRSEGVFEYLAQLAKTCPIYTVRGTVFHAFSLIASTWDGVQALHEIGWRCVVRNHHRLLQVLLREPPQGKDTRLTYPSVSDADTNESLRAGFYIYEDSDDDTESLSAILDGMDVVDSTPARKSQTLPHDTKPPPYMRHQRSFSDCAPVIEELGNSNVTDVDSRDLNLSLGSPEWTVSKRGSQIKNKILSSFRRKSGKRRDSSTSKTSNSSSASERLSSFFYTRKGRKFMRNSDSGEEIDFGSEDTNQSRSFTDDDEWQKDDSLSQRVGELSPIPSGASLSTQGSQILGSSVGTSKLPSEPVDISRHDRWHQFSSPYFNSYLKPVNRRVSESSYDEGLQKNSLRDFISSSYDQSTILRGYEGRQMVRSPSGCSEISSIVSFGTTPLRSNSLFHQRSASICGNFDKPRFQRVSAPAMEIDVAHSSGQCYLGLSLPSNLDDLLLDTSIRLNRKNEVDFECKNDTSVLKMSLIKEEFEEIEVNKEVLTSESKGDGRDYDLSKDGITQNIYMENNGPKLSKVELDLITTLGGKEFQKLVSDGRTKFPPENTIFQYHTEENCPICCTRVDNLSNEEEASVRSDSIEPKNRFYSRLKILKYIVNLSTSFRQKIAESDLIALKQKYPESFQDLCLYVEIYHLMSSYSYRLNVRRFVQELFMEAEWRELFDEADSLLSDSVAMSEAISHNINHPDILRSMQADCKQYTGKRWNDIGDISELSMNEFVGFDSINEDQ